MSYNNYYKRLRIKCVQIFDAMHFEKENHKKCHKRNWGRIGCFIFGISYDTYLSYLKVDTSDIPEIPSEAIAQLKELIEALKKREKNRKPSEKAKAPGATRRERDEDI